MAFEKLKGQLNDFFKDDYPHAVLQGDGGSWYVIFNNKLVKTYKTFKGADNYLTKLCA